MGDPALLCLTEMQVFGLIYFWIGSIVATFVSIDFYQKLLRDGKERKESIMIGITVGVVYGGGWGFFPFFFLWQLYTRWEDKKYRYGRREKP